MFVIIAGVIATIAVVATFIIIYPETKQPKIKWKPQKQKQSLGGLH